MIPWLFFSACGHDLYRRVSHRCVKNWAKLDHQRGSRTYRSLPSEFNATLSLIHCFSHRAPSPALPSPLRSFSRTVRFELYRCRIKVAYNLSSERFTAVWPLNRERVEQKKKKNTKKNTEKLLSLYVGNFLVNLKNRRWFITGLDLYFIITI